MSRNILLFFLVLVLFSFYLNPVEGRKHQAKNSKPHNKQHKKDRSRDDTAPDSDLPAPGPLPPPAYGSYPTHSTIFNVFSFGAKGDGVSDDSKALEAAWEVACKVPGATVLVPAEYKFLINPITLQGPCNPHFVLQIDGHVLAPPKVGSWPKSSLFQWLNFKWLHNFTIQGSGTVNGQGFDWWSPSKISYIQKRSKHIPYKKPTALRFYSSYDVTVRDIKITNSPQCHLKFDNCGRIEVNNITISSPENSPNTDGIHLQNTKDIEIHHSDIGSGDDCVSIQTGCSNIHIHHINCGPGHGISIGGLGKDKSAACVSNIIVDEVSIQNTPSGVRIKTWQGGVGSVKNVSFSNIQVSNVKIPIIIDQYYCDKHKCKNQTGAVAISGVKYDKIIGTYTVKPIHLACSDEIPCIDVDLNDIQLKPSSGQYKLGFQSQSLCWNSYGKSQAPLVPSSIDYCLRRGGGGAVKGPARSLDKACRW